MHINRAEVLSRSLMKPVLVLWSLVLARSVRLTPGLEEGYTKTLQRRRWLSGSMYIADNETDVLLDFNDDDELEFNESFRFKGQEAQLEPGRKRMRRSRGSNTLKRKPRKRKKKAVKARKRKQKEKKKSARNTKRPNLLFIVTDEHRFDVLGFVQDRMKAYRNKLHVKTPNIDRLADKGVYFESAYCQFPSCGPSRTSLLTGCTSERTGVQKNSLVNANNYKKMSMFKNKVEKLETFEQLLVEERGYVAEMYGKWHVVRYRLCFGEALSRHRPYMPLCSRIASIKVAMAQKE